jgi:POT family proton-dependent oligopeptide transporter
MFKGHPKGLYVAFFSNMGERFGFYTMMAILVLFLQAKYGLSVAQAGSYYSWFYFAIYALALLGGIIADATNKYKLVILTGIIIMFAGYAVVSIPGMSLGVTLTGLFIIALGNGLFKGNLQAVVGQMYDNEKYSKIRDTAYMIFYMGINVGAFFAPFVATGVRNWFLKTQGFLHDASLPEMCHAFTRGELSHVADFQALADKVSGHPVADLTQFTGQYLDAFSKGYNYAFGVAAGAMILSLLAYVIFNRHLPSKERSLKPVTAAENKNTTTSGNNPVTIVLSLVIGAAVTAVFYLITQNIDLSFPFGLFVAFAFYISKISTREERLRISSLLLVFVVVIFFWMSFHQNGLTLTLFARDYTIKEVGPFTNIFFNLESMLAFIGSLAGLYLLLGRKKPVEKIVGLLMFLVMGFLTYRFVRGYPQTNPIAPEVFQSFNPLFIVVLTFPVLAVFSYLRSRNAEPSTPRKIGIGMFIAALGFLVVLIASADLISPRELQYLDELGKPRFNPVPDSSRVVPYWLISSYLILTIAELFLSPMGLSFVSKVAPPRFQGLMQGGWLLATAVGNKLLVVGSIGWTKLALWQLWAVFIICCIISGAFIFSMLRRLEKATR